VTKTFTALALMRKVEEGVLDLDAPLRHYLPSFALANADWAEQVTPRHLITHTAGWEGDTGPEEAAEYCGEDELERVLDRMPHILLHTAPGTVYHYNNLAFSVAGRLLEVIHGTRFERAIEDLVSDPLKLELFFDSESRPAGRVSTGHPGEENPRWIWPAGGVQCDLRAMLRYARAHLGPKNAIEETAISEQILAVMWPPEIEIDDPARSSSLSWGLDRMDDCRIICHAGRVCGQTALLELIPERDFALIALTNSQSGSALCWPVEKWAREGLLDLVRPDPEYVRLSDEILQQYRGVYSHAFDVVFHIEPREDVRDGGLEIRGADQWESSRGPIAFVEQDKFLVTDGPMEGDDGTFLRGDDGEIRWLRWWGRLHARKGQ
jgi:CubicO group peptidase (beta-lactamase class C family)